MSQLSLFDMLDAPAPVETPARAGEAPRMCFLQCQFNAPRESSYCIVGVCHMELALFAFDPSPRFLLDHFAGLDYYLSRPNVLPREWDITLLVGYDGEPKPTPENTRFLHIPVQSVYDEYARR